MNQEENKQVNPKAYQNTLSRYIRRLRTIEYEIHKLWQHKILQVRYWGASEAEITDLQLNYSNNLIKIQKDIKTAEQKLLNEFSKN